MLGSGKPNDIVAKFWIGIETVLINKDYTISRSTLDKNMPSMNQYAQKHTDDDEKEDDPNPHLRAEESFYKDFE